MSSKWKQYLGDSVYADVDNGVVKLTTENGLPHDPSNEIYLEREVFAELVKWEQWVRESIKQE